MDAVANHIWQSTICALAAGALAWMFRANNATVRYWIWFAAALKFLIPFAALAAVANRIPLPQSPQRAGAAIEAAAVVFRSSAPALTGAASTFAMVMWLSGAFVIVSMWLWRSHLLAARVLQLPRVLDGVVHDTLRRVEREEGIGKPTAIVASTHATEPGVFGIRTPVLIWPEHLTRGLSEAQIEAIVAHEVCHIVRRDNLLALVQMAVSAIFWFHPIVWWIAARLVDERERACDERVLARDRRPATYAESILETCRLCIASPLVNVSGVTGGDLKQRIARIMRNEPSRPLDARRKAALLTTAFVLLFLPTATGVSACRSDSDVKTAEPVSAQTVPPVTDNEVNRPGGGVTTPRLIRETKPQYTARTIQDKVQGEVLLECVVKADGTVGERKIVKPLHPDLDQAALDAAAQWVFEPGTRNGKPANVLVTIAMAFTLKK
jgi:bla regulator protein blaR1